MTLLIVINCTFVGIKKIFFFVHEFVYSDVCNFLARSLTELSVFLLSRCPASDL